MKSSILSVFIVLMLSLCAFGQEQVKPENAPSALSDEDSIRQVLIEEALGQWLRNNRHESTVFYIAVNEKKDPGKLLFNSLIRPDRQIKKASESYESGSGEIRDKRSKKVGVLLTVSKLTWKNKDEVLAWGGTQEGNMAAFSCNYTVRRENGVWAIFGSAQCSIS